jgi:hypothetical protein
VEIQIIPEDVERAARLMGKDFSDPERMAAIQCLDSCDVQACPGSGKTTAVVAKLVILAEKLKGSNQGICVLSHTNAAREEIEKSLGPYTTILFRYPNFIGTIQAFTDLYLAIPAYIEQYGVRPSIINDEIYENITIRQYSRLNFRTRHYLDQKRGGQGEEYFANLSYRFDSIDEIAYFDGRDEKDFPANPNTPSYQDVFRLKREITRLGSLTYHDAFSLAHAYIQRYPSLVGVLSKRFPFVIVDEMQDTDRYQLCLLDILFGGRSVVQKYGDSNQSIYGHRSESLQPVWTPQPGYQINTSMRLSPSIARLSKNLGVLPQEIEGNPNHPDHIHTIILFEYQQALQVIPYYGRLIEGEGLWQGPFMALGAVGRLNARNLDYLSISSYWPDFELYQTQNRASNTFWDNIGLAQKSIRQDGNFLMAKDFILEAIVRLLRAQNNRSASGMPYSVTVFVSDIRKTGDQNLYFLRFVLLSWCKALYTKNNLDSNHVLKNLQHLLGLIGIQLTPQTILEIQNAPVALQLPDGLRQQPVTNRYHHSDTVEITIDTIHAAKGQTHQATLLLETCYHQHDLEQIKPYLVGQRLGRPGVRILQRFLPLAYVACTRPTHLLCLAIHRNHVAQEDRQQLEHIGWHIHDL